MSAKLPLCIAAEQGNLETVKRLIQEGANIDEKDKDNVSGKI
jgi:ankyrin repeat protein